MNKFITLFIVLVTSLSLQAKDISLGLDSVDNACLCKVFSEKVNIISTQNTINKSDERRMKEFMSRKKEHCSK